jgi:hypothetical protein
MKVLEDHPKASVLPWFVSAEFRVFFIGTLMIVV